MTREELLKMIESQIKVNEARIDILYNCYEKHYLRDDVNLLRMIEKMLKNTENSDKTYEQGMHDIWGMFQKIYSDVYNPMILGEVFGYGFIVDVIERMTPECALEKFEAYEKKKKEEAEKPVVGDVVDIYHKEHSNNKSSVHGILVGEDASWY